MRDEPFNRCPQRRDDSVVRFVSPSTLDGVDLKFEVGRPERHDEVTEERDLAEQTQLCGQGSQKPTSASHLWSPMVSIVSTIRAFVPEPATARVFAHAQVFRIADGYVEQRARPAVVSGGSSR